MDPTAELLIWTLCWLAITLAAVLMAEALGF